MLRQEEFKKLAKLLNNLYLCTGIKFSLMDDCGHEVYTSSYRAPFCSAVMGENGGEARCMACDCQIVEKVYAERMKQKYICHAGLYEIAIPVMDGDQVGAVILFGQLLDDADRDKQWERVRKNCAWCENQEQLYQAFLKLKRISSDQMEACMEIVHACISEVRLAGLKAVECWDDAHQLHMFVEANFAQRLTITDMANALHVGKTKLYALCQKRYHMTPMQLLEQIRISSAQELLHTSHESVKVIAAAVGFEDPNYFVKVFRKWRGCTPTQYRRRVKS